MKDYYEIKNISSQKALEIVSKASDIWIKKWVSISVNIVDKSMSLVAFLKTDWATPHSAFTSRKKANTSASTGKPTWWMSEDLSIILPMWTDNNLTNIWWWFPLVFDWIFVWWLWISWWTVEQDIEIWKEILLAIWCDKI